MEVQNSLVNTNNRFFMHTVSKREKNYLDHHLSLSLVYLSLKLTLASLQRGGKNTREKIDDRNSFIFHGAPGYFLQKNCS